MGLSLRRRALPLAVTIAALLAIPGTAGAATVVAAGSHPTVRGSHAAIINGKGYAPSKAPQAVKQVIWSANKIRHRPYKWGSGHGTWDDSGYDCSGAVSYALHGAGLGDVVATLRALADRAACVQLSMDRITSLLHVSARPLALKGVGEVLEQLRVLTGMGPAKCAWFNPSQRLELQQVVQRCLDNDAQDARVRANLVARLVPAAFADENAPIASRSASFQAGWSRLLPRWWS